MTRQCRCKRKLSSAAFGKNENIVYSHFGSSFADVAQMVEQLHGKE